MKFKRSTWNNDLFVLEKIMKSGSSSKYLSLKDYSVSGEEFILLYNKEYDMLVTSPQPAKSELPKYYQSEAYISHTDSKETLVDKTYQRVKHFMLKKKLKWIFSETEKAGNLLDIGAGTGDFLLEAKKKGWNVAGVEPSHAARILASKKGVELTENSEGFQSGSFDVITMWHVLEHVPDLEKQIKEIKSLLKNKGLLVIAVPNYKSFDADYYGKFWAAYDVPRHLWHFSQFSISKIFEEQNFEVRKTLPLKFDAFYVSLLSEKYKNNKANALSALKTGFISNLKAKKSGEYSSLAYFIEKD